MARVDRNAPCPCGSGKKYKRCCQDKTERSAEAAQRLHGLDHQVVAEVLGWAQREQRGLFDWTVEMCALGDDDEPPFHIVYASALATLTGRRDATLASRYLLAEGKRLPRETRTWLKALVNAWLGLWEIQEIGPDGLRMGDLMTHETRLVTDPGLAASARRGEVVCGRVVDAGSQAVMVCTHPHALTASQAEAVIGAFLLEEDGPLPHAPHMLRGEDGNELMRCWHDACVEFAQPRLPAIRDFDGDVFQTTVDTYEFKRRYRDHIEERLRSLPGVAEDGRDAEDLAFVLVDPQSDTWLAALRLGRAHLEVETNSEARADRVDHLLAGILRDHLVHVDRDRMDRQDELVAQVGRDPSGTTTEEIEVLRGPDVDAVILDYKTAQYARWPDQHLPLLGGLTPREVMDDAKLRQVVVATLNDIEATEARLPPGQRYDVGALREALGIAADE